MSKKHNDILYLFYHFEVWQPVISEKGIEGIPLSGYRERGRRRKEGENCLSAASSTAPVGDRSERQESPITRGRPFLLTSLRRERSNRQLSFWTERQWSEDSLSIQYCPTSTMSFWDAERRRISYEVRVWHEIPHMRSEWHRKGKGGKNKTGANYVPVFIGVLHRHNGFGMTGYSFRDLSHAFEMTIEFLVGLTPDEE